MKENKFKLTVTGEEATGMSTCAVKFDGTPAQFMDAAAAALTSAKDAFVNNFDEEDALSVFKAAVAEFMDNGFVEGEALRDIALDRMKAARDENQKEFLKKLLGGKEEAEAELDKLLESLRKVLKADD